jgi:membrane associated rhomboid family serine protease
MEIASNVMINNEEQGKFKHLKNIINKFPWFLFSWTIVLIFVFVYVDNSNYAYGCKTHMLQWRLMTYHMFHLDIEHLVFNLFAFWLFGLYINMVYNDFVNIIIYIIGVVISGFTYYIDCDIQQSYSRVVGASGGVCAIVGAVFITAVWRFGKGVYEVGQEHNIMKRIRISMLKYMLSYTSIFSVFGMVSYDVALYLIDGDDNISHIAHFGGYISGTLVGLVIITVKTYMFKK